MHICTCMYVSMHTICMHACMCQRRVCRTREIGYSGLGGGGDDDDIGTQTPRTISPQEPFYSVFTVLS